MKKYIAILLSLLLLVGCTEQSNQEKTYRQISMKEAITMMNEESGYLRFRAGILGYLYPR